MSDQFFKPEERPVPSSAEFPADVLTADNEQKSRSGFNGSQNQMANAIGRGVQTDIPNGQAGSVKPNLANGAGSRPSELNGGLSLNGVAVTAKPVDANHLEGSNRGDHRAPSRDTADASLRQAADNGGPRQPMGQFTLSGKQTSGNFQSYPSEETNGV